MKKLLFTLALLPVFCFGQSSDETMRIQKMYDAGYFKIDGDNIVVSRVIDDIPGTKNEIYINVKNYFSRTYKDSKSVLQTDDKDAGTVIGKGYYSNFYSTNYIMSSVKFSAYHILRIDIKDGKVRVICSVSDMDIISGSPQKKDSYLIVDYAPLTDKRKFDKGKQTEAFIQLVALMNATVDSIEKALKTGSLSIEKEDW
ncbi:MAG: DUF4468 domain-containing protein [Candidatus Azobacteroides sp.]|nr:DUF4468 domain-containing protein [Candidatus Azobacteroides sp.]